MKTKKSTGFTLIELLVVISIIALLSSVILVALQSAKLKGQDSARIQGLVQVRNALELYRTAHGSYPQGTLSASTLANDLSPYISKLPVLAGDTDPNYTAPSDGSTYVYEIHNLNTAPSSGIFYDSSPGTGCTPETCAIVTPSGGSSGNSGGTGGTGGTGGNSPAPFANPFSSYIQISFDPSSDTVNWSINPNDPNAVNCNASLSFSAGSTNFNNPNTGNSGYIIINDPAFDSGNDSGNFTLSCIDDQGNAGIQTIPVSKPGQGPVQ